MLAERSYDIGADFSQGGVMENVAKLVETIGGAFITKGAHGFYVISPYGYISPILDTIQQARAVATLAAIIQGGR